ncbi:MAG: MFS transporter [Myxococcales bacterium]|nr:MFS transporter [Myxococcales bacterium]
MSKRRFLPFFATQFLGAFNDNLMKNALMIGVAYKSMTLLGLRSESVVALAAGIFILPFFLFSAWAGQLADKVSKATLIRWVKAVEIVLMLGAAAGFWLENLPLLLVVLFLMGLQSTFFGPAKYSILPELVRPHELTGGNALVETGTFIAILLGTIAGGVLIGIGGPYVGPSVVAVALLGYLASLAIPPTAPASPELPLTANLLAPAVPTYRAARQSVAIFNAILAISWFWFLGASVLTLLPTYGKSVLGANEDVVTFLLALFCVGVAIGSLLCERLGGKKVELGLVPFGSIGLSIVAIDLCFASPAPHEPGALIGLAAFIEQPGSWRIIADFLLFAVFGGLYTVPLYTLIQQRASDDTRSRVIAANNIANALFMVVSAAVLIALPKLGLGIAQIFLFLGVVNAMVAVYIYTVVPEFFLRFVAWIVAHVLYRIRVRGEEHLPDEGGVLLVANHVTFVDWLIISSAYQRPVRFVMHHTFLRLPLIGFLFRGAKVIPIASAREDAAVLAAALDRIDEELRAGEPVCIFPEGRLTTDGTLGPFRPGVEAIVQRTPVPVVPIGLGGLWGSFFSRKDGAPFRRPFRRFWSRVRLTVGAPVQAADVSASGLEDRVAALL